jgi:hypothetical protein
MKPRTDGLRLPYLSDENMLSDLCSSVELSRNGNHTVNCPVQAG